MDTQTQLLVATLMAIEILIASITKNIRCVCGELGKQVRIDGSVLYTFTANTSLWAAGDKAWRIAAIESLSEQYHGRNPRGPSCTHFCSEYRTLSASFLCANISEQRELLESLTLLAERTSKETNS